MKQETINAIELMAKTDPDATPEVIRAIVRACRKPTEKRQLILAREAMSILEITRPTLRKLTRTGKLHEVKPTPRKTRFFLDEVESLAYAEA